MSHSPQPRYLTLTEVVVNYSLFCGVGAWLAGLKGGFGGAVLISLAYARLIWISIKQ